MTTDQSNNCHTPTPRLLDAVTSQIKDLFARPLSPGLYLVATPIGNLGDMTLRALTTLAMADHAYCEDTRVSAPMLARFGIDRRLKAYHEHNAEGVRDDIVAAIVERRESVALISDAGMPAISDPGFKLVRALADADSDVFVVPGASAVVAAISASGLATDDFRFAGFLPAKQTARRTRIEKLAATTATLLFYESPHRLAASLADLAAVLGPRPGAVARELTKKFEEVRRGPLDALAAWAAETPARGEIAIVVEGARQTGDVDDAAILAALKEAHERLRPSDAAREIARSLNIPRARVYELGLSLKRGDS